MALGIYINEVMSHVNVGKLDATEYEFGDPVLGIGEASFSCATPSSLEPNSLLKRIEPNKFEVVLADGDPDRGAPILWAGWIDRVDPDPEHAVVYFHATHWKGWFYDRVIPPGTFTENTISKDKYQIAYDLLDWACNDKGAPALYRPSKQATQPATLTIQPWMSVGDAIDSLAMRDSGFEWSIAFRMGSQTGLMELLAEIWVRRVARSGSTSMLFLDNTRTTNRISVGRMAADGSMQVTRQYASSDGEDPVWSKDENPGLASDTILLREGAKVFQDIRSPTLLFQYARGERAERDNPYSTVPVTLTVDSPPVSSYRVGDRARLRVKDAWRDVDRTGVRIVDRSITKKPGSPTKVTILLDLADVFVPMRKVGTI